MERWGLVIGGLITGIGTILAALFPKIVDHKIHKIEKLSAKDKLEVDSRVAFENSLMSFVESNIESVRDELRETKTQLRLMESQLKIERETAIKAENRSNELEGKLAIATSKISSLELELAELRKKYESDYNN